MANEHPLSFRRTENGTAYYYGWATHCLFSKWAVERRNAEKTYTFTEFFNSLRPIQKLSVGVEIFQESANESHR
jgi:hypothetical protein